MVRICHQTQKICCYLHMFIGCCLDYSSEGKGVESLLNNCCSFSTCEKSSFNLASLNCMFNCSWATLSWIRALTSSLTATVQGVFTLFMALSSGTDSSNFTRFSWGRSIEASVRFCSGARPSSSFGHCSGGACLTTEADFPSSYFLLWSLGSGPPVMVESLRCNLGWVSVSYVNTWNSCLALALRVLAVTPGVLGGSMVFRTNFPSNPVTLMPFLRLMLLGAQFENGHSKPTSQSYEFFWRKML